MKRTCMEDAVCPVARALDEIGDWWTLLIVRDALHGARRFSDFERSLGLAKNILSARLRKMVGCGILELRPEPDGRSRGAYHLTEKGRSLQLVLVAIRQWGEDHLYEEGEALTTLVAKSSGSRVARLAVTAADGQALAADDLALKPSVYRRTRRAPRAALRR